MLKTQLDDIKLMDNFCLQEIFYFMQNLISGIRSIEYF